MKDYFEIWKKKNPKEPDSKAPWYKILRSSVGSVFGCEFIFCSLIIFIAEGLALAYTYFLVYLIRYLQDKSQGWEEGLKLVAIYASAVFVSALLRN